MDLARFPRELERAILEAAADSDSNFIPTLLLVAHRAHVWLEPLLYRQVHISMNCRWKRAQDAFFRIATTRPPSFLAKSVRVMTLEFHDGTTVATQDLLDRVYPALLLCTGVQEVAVNGSEEMKIGPTLLPLLSAMPLRRLGVFFEDLMPHPIPMEGHATAFSALTHLDVYDNEEQNIHSRDLSRIIPFLAALPNLTHLAVNILLDLPVVKRILDGCSRLQILAFLIPALDYELSTFMDGVQRIAESSGDPRIFGTTYKSWTEVFSTTQFSFWRAIDILVDQKRNGLVDRNHASTGDIYNKDTQDAVAKQIRALF
ncbi:hypothetical protein MIND_00291200 [Mycena indigotica]|uniref:Uncharacterized protein n=1 Tax=Mycena indigotica TaxID=2126181 RepID=A0A8H6T9P2_9AGAR|nr:uncharacterized protein MIND_00291200 [Mycena indigotica]KAF7312761.1 hypothetical protein MIND_00291200 [Mycena indigotica]